VATLEEAKAQFQKSWDEWKAWAKLEEVERGGAPMNREQPMSITIRQIEFELDKAEHGMGMRYDAERVAQLRHMLRGSDEQAGQSGGGLGRCLPFSVRARTRSPFLVFIHAVHLPQL
jgi:hypothetical protein